MKLKEICHSRTGDKGDISNGSLIPWNESDYELIKEKVTEITDRIIRRTAGTTLADFFAVSVCPVSFGLLPFQY